jgi:SAM-dependent methyltransferase
MTELHDWFQTPPGRYVLAWERAQFDAILTDVFGYHALQLGLPEVNTLAANRMPHRWLAEVGPLDELPRGAGGDADVRPPALVVDSTALPFAEASLDLMVLPHTLEHSPDPHATLREVQRVLVPEGKVVIAGINPISLWGLRQLRGHLYRSMGSGRLYLPAAGEFISHWRLRDWLRLLEFELESVSFGCYGPAVHSAGALTHFRWMDRAGSRWWPILGAAYVAVAVKRTQGPKWVGGAVWTKAAVPVGAPVPVANCAGPAPSASRKDLESS